MELFNICFYRKLQHFSIFQGILIYCDFFSGDCRLLQASLQANRTHVCTHTPRHSLVCCVAFHGPVREIILQLQQISPD